MTYHYRLFGLRISSDMELPELTAEDAGGMPDVHIRQQCLPEPGGQSDELFADSAAAGFFIEGVAQYRVNSGREILVDPRPEAPIRNVRLFLLGSAFGLLLHQRGYLPLHASTIEIGGRGYAFMGPSGSGKSTFAAAFHDEGYRVIADDVCVVGFDDDGLAIAYTGVPRLRLWEDALAASGRSAGDYQVSYAGDEQFRKFDVPTNKEALQPVPLAAIVELASGDEVDCQELSGVEAVETLFANTYRGSFIASAGEPAAHWRACMQLVAAVPIFRLHRPFRLDALSQIIAHFEADALCDRGKRDLADDD